MQKEPWGKNWSNWILLTRGSHISVTIAGMVFLNSLIMAKHRAWSVELTHGFPSPNFFSALFVVQKFYFGNGPTSPHL